MTPATLALLERAESLSQAATEGPWLTSQCTYADHAAIIADESVAISHGGNVLHFVHCAPLPNESIRRSPANTGNGPMSKPNAAFIAASRTLVPALAAELRAAAAREAELSKLVREARSVFVRGTFENPIMRASWMARATDTLQALAASGTAPAPTGDTNG